jgi:hypothetical protein
MPSTDKWLEEMCERLDRVRAQALAVIANSIALRRLGRERRIRRDQDREE